MQQGRLVLAEHASIPALTIFYEGPASYTGEDMLEVQLPGNPALLDRVLQGVLAGHDVRLAEAGEFTRRAFLNGKIDLSRAEGIAATVGALSDGQLRAAKMLRRGRLGQWSEQLVERLTQLLALVEAGIDFVDQDDVVPISPADLDAGLAGIEREIAQLGQRCRPWSQLDALPWVVLAGPPNAGKSTLFNALLGRERALASAVAGTTRDVLTEPLTLDTDRGPVEVLLVDMAGLDAPAGGLDRAMQSRARDAIERAELVLQLGPTVRSTGDTPTLHVAAKSDAQAADPDAEVCVSAVTGEGLDRLRALIAGRLAGRAVAVGGEAMALQSRHQRAIADAAEAIGASRRLIAAEVSASALSQPELVALLMREAINALAALGGQMTPDDVIGKVFASFCVGK